MKAATAGLLAAGAILLADGLFQSRNRKTTVRRTEAHASFGKAGKRGYVVGMAQAQRPLIPAREIHRAAKGTVRFLCRFVPRR